MKISLSELDVIFISYDEPNADENWQDLLTKCPWAKRSHGVFGSDAAHKAAAKLSETSRFIGIDADNKIDPAIFDLEFDESVINGNQVFSFKGKNVVNGLVYGNGGIKVWPVKTVMEMRTHEVSETKRGEIEFCWDLDYLQMDKIFSTVYNNGTPLQAFRAGFREGCKMSLDEGNLIPKENFKSKIYPLNFKRLKTWMSIGSDAKNGDWCIYGTLLGFYKTNMSDWDYKNVRDFRHLVKIFEDEVKPRFKTEKIGASFCDILDYKWDNEKLLSEIRKLGKEIQDEYNFTIPYFNKKDSAFIKELL